MDTQPKKTARRHGLDLVVFFLLLAGGYLAFSTLMGVTTPFAAVASNSMQPALTRGDLVILKGVPPADVRPGDIVVLSVPSAFQKEFGYPGNIIHRVTSVSVSGSSVSFQTKGDATNPDPFQVASADVKGRYAAKIPGLGFLLLYFRSPQGLFFLVFATVLISVYLFGQDALSGVRKGILGPAAPRPGAQAASAQQPTEVQQSLDSFAGAMREYATHLMSHTAAVQHMGQASEQITQSVQEQRRVLELLAQVLSGQAGVEVRRRLQAPGLGRGQAPIIDVEPIREAAAPTAEDPLVYEQDTWFGLGPDGQPRLLDDSNDSVAAQALAQDLFEVLDTLGPDGQLL
ncbi:MAG: signal peptidase I [Chloroflexota bacterium]|nr:signal peptidase I [Chloroflexota bacterium]